MAANTITLNGVSIQNNYDGRATFTIDGKAIPVEKGASIDVASGSLAHVDITSIHMRPYYPTTSGTLIGPTFFEVGDKVLLGGTKVKYEFAPLPL